MTLLSLGIDLVAIIVLALGLYFQRYRRREVMVAMIGLNVAVLAVSAALASASVGLGLGLGLFIAKTLLERSGARLSFYNANERGKGAVVQVAWPRDVFLSNRTASASMFDTA